MSSPANRLPLDVAVIDDLDVVRRGLLSLPMTHGEQIATVKVFNDVADLDFASSPPHVVVLDYWLDQERRPSLEHVARLHEWGAHVILYTSEEAPHPLQQALASGVDGICLKKDGVDALVSAIAAVGQGEFVLSSPAARALIDHRALSARLTPSEVETLRALAYGKTPAEIAAARQVTPNTVSTHVEHIRAKYADATGTKVNRARMVREGLRDGYLDRRLAQSDPE